MLICHRVLCSFAIAVYIPKPGQRVAGRKCPSQPETMIKASVFYLQSVLSMQPVTVSVSAPVILSVRPVRTVTGSRQESCRHDPGFIPHIHSIRAPLSHSSASRPRTSFDQPVLLVFIPNRSLEKYAFFLSYFCYFYSKNQALNNITSYIWVYRACRFRAICQAVRLSPLPRA